MPPEPLDAAIIYATVGDLVPLALKAVRKGGRVVCAGIHMSDIPRFPYDLLWEERQVLSVANLTRQDGLDFLRLAPQIGIVTTTTRLPLASSQRGARRSSRRAIRGRRGIGSLTASLARASIREAVNSIKLGIDTIAIMITTTDAAQCSLNH